MASGRWEAAREHLMAAAGYFEWLTARLRAHQRPESIDLKLGGDHDVPTLWRFAPVREACETLR